VLDTLSLIRIAIALPLLALASYSDLRTRMASDLYWAVIGLAGLALFAAQIFVDGDAVLGLIMLLPLGFVLLDTMWDRKGVLEDGVNVVPMALYILCGVVIVSALMLMPSDEGVWMAISVLIMYVLYFLLYQFGIIKGGADAKALMALSLLFPIYPLLGPFPVFGPGPWLAQMAFPFSLLVLLYAGLLSLIVPLALLILNLKRGDRQFPAMFVGYRMDIGEVEKKHVWPLDRVEDGVVVARSAAIPDDDVAPQLEALRAAGATRIWVTPKIPFLVPMTFGVLLAALLGNFIFAFIH
jgi:preflagellin peptidase FlaK